MLEFAEKMVLAGMGVLTLSQQKVEEMVKEAKDRLNLSEEEGKKLVTKLQDAAQENQKKLEKLALEEVKKSCERMGVVTKEEFNKLSRKVADLEKRLKALEK
ncbi:MAG: phasin family protein [Deltaproteobacteria bacterium]|nr:phasin family protein [Deltaproteobacteria bacterium]